MATTGPALLEPGPNLYETRNRRPSTRLETRPGEWVSNGTFGPGCSGSSSFLEARMTGPETEKLRLEGEPARLSLVHSNRLLWKKYKGYPLWALARDLTQHGSGYSAEVCRSAGLDPHQKITGPELKAL